MLSLPSLVSEHGQLHLEKWIQTTHVSHHDRCSLVVVRHSYCAEVRASQKLNISAYSPLTIP